MNHREQHLADLLLQDAMDEVFHGGPSPELAKRILSAANGEAPAAETPVPPLRLVRPTRRPRWRWALEGAVAAGIAAMLLLLLMPAGKDGVPTVPESPTGVAATHDAEFKAPADAVSYGESQDMLVERGWYLLSDGAPPLVHGAHRVDGVKGMVVVRVGSIPLGVEVQAVQPWLNKNGIEETEMLNGNWIKAGALAICVLAGSAFVDEQYVNAQGVERERKEPEKRDAADRVKDLEDEIKDLEERLEEARELENERERAARIKRIEAALEGKREDLRKMKERIENARKEAEKKEGKRRDGRGGAEGRNGHGGPEGKNGSGGAKGQNGHGGPEGKNGSGGAEGRNGHGGEREREAEERKAREERERKAREGEKREPERKKERRS